MMTKEEAVAKAMKLLKLAESDNVNEAALAAQRAQEILSRYEIDQAMLQDSVADEPDEAIENFQKKGAPLDEGKVKIHRWKCYLANVTARANQCRIFTSGNQIGIVGRASNVSTVRYLYSMLSSQTDALAKKNGKGCGRTWANNYRFGVVDAIKEKFAELNAKLSEDMHKENAGNSQALIKLDNALATIKKKDTEVVDWLKANMKLHKTTSYMRQDANARDLGRADGASLSISGARGGLNASRQRIGQ